MKLCDSLTQPADVQAVDAGTTATGVTASGSQQQCVKLYDSLRQPAHVRAVNADANADADAGADAGHDAVIDLTAEDGSAQEVEKASDALPRDTAGAGLHGIVDRANAVLLSLKEETTLHDNLPVQASWSRHLPVQASWSGHLPTQASWSGQLPTQASWPGHLPIQASGSAKDTEQTSSCYHSVYQTALRMMNAQLQGQAALRMMHAQLPSQAALQMVNTQLPGQAALQMMNAQLQGQAALRMMAVQLQGQVSSSGQSTVQGLTQAGSRGPIDAQSSSLSQLNGLMLNQAISQAAAYAVVCRQIPNAGLSGGMVFQMPNQAVGQTEAPVQLPSQAVRQTEAPVQQTEAAACASPSVQSPKQALSQPPQVTQLPHQATASQQPSHQLPNSGPNPQQPSEPLPNQALEVGSDVEDLCMLCAYGMDLAAAFGCLLDQLQDWPGTLQCSSVM